MAVTLCFTESTCHTEFWKNNGLVVCVCFFFLRLDMWAFMKHFAVSFIAEKNCKSKTKL